MSRIIFQVTTSTPRFLRRADSGMPPNEALTPKSDTTSTESSTTSPPERAHSDSSSGVHSGEETCKDEVVIRRSAVGPKSIIKPSPSVIHEEPYGRITHMKMSTFKDGSNSNSNTLPLRSTSTENQPPIDYSCNTMPLPPSSLHQIHRVSANEPKRTTLPNNIRYSAGQYLRQMPQLTNAESPYGTCGLGSGHHTFSKHIQNDVAPQLNMLSTSPPQHQYSPGPMQQAQQQQPIHYQTQSSSFTTFNHPPMPPSMSPNSNYAIVTDHSYNNNGSIYSHNTLQMH